MALINFFSRLTYENILSPMILARSGDNSIILGIVNALHGHRRYCGRCHCLRQEGEQEKDSGYLRLGCAVPVYGHSRIFGQHTVVL